MSCIKSPAISSQYTSRRLARGRPMHGSQPALLHTACHLSKDVAAPEPLDMNSLFKLGAVKHAVVVNVEQVKHASVLHPVQQPKQMVRCPGHTAPARHPSRASESLHSNSR